MWLSLSVQRGKTVGRWHIGRLTGVHKAVCLLPISDTLAD